MKKILSTAIAGMTILAFAGSAFAVVPETTPTTAPQASTQKAPTHHQAKAFDNQELLSLLKLDATTFHEQLKAGKSLADIAGTQGVAVQQVIDLLTKQASARLDEAVQAGKLTQEQAVQKKAELQEHIKNHVEKQGGFGMKGERGGKGHGGPKGMKGPFRDAASILGLDEQELMTQLQSGKSLAQIAQEKGISKDDLVNKLMEKEKERLTQMIDKTWQLKEGK